MWQNRDGALFGPTTLLVVRATVAAVLMANSGTSSTMSHTSVTVRPVAKPPPIRPPLPSRALSVTSMPSYTSDWPPYWLSRFTTLLTCPNFAVLISSRSQICSPLLDNRVLVGAVMQYESKSEGDTSVLSVTRKLPYQVR